MNRARYAATALLLALCAPAARPQAVLPERVGHEGGLRENVYGIGIALGATSGIGLSFRQHFPGFVSYQIIAGGIKIDNQSSYSFGAELQYDFVRGYGVRFFAAGAVGYYYSGERHNEIDAPARIGFGIGGEVPIQGGFHISGELLFTFFSNGNVFPLPQVGMHYYFY